MQPPGSEGLQARHQPGVVPRFSEYAAKYKRCVTFTAILLPGKAVNYFKTLNDSVYQLCITCKQSRTIPNASPVFMHESDRRPVIPPGLNEMLRDLSKVAPITRDF